MIGRPVTALTESAAPPRASPSSLVSTTPSKAIRSLERGRDVGGLLAGHRVEHEQRVRRAGRRRDTRELVHQLLVDLEAAGGVDDHDVETIGRAPARGRLAPPRPGRRSRCGRRGRRSGAPSCSSWSTARRALEVGGDERRACRPSSAKRGASLAAAVVLPEPWSPASRITERCPSSSSAASGAHQLGQLVVDDLDDLLARGEALEHLLAERALADPLDEAARRPRG